MYGQSRIFAAALLLAAAACSQPREDEFVTGTVKWYNPEKGFGFITPDHGSGDVFVHSSAIQEQGLQALRDGQKVRFVVTRDGKGPTASRVQLVQQEPE